MPTPTPEVKSDAPERSAGRSPVLWVLFFAALLAGVVLALLHLDTIPVLLDTLT
jgi:hypothetical protein